MELKPLIEKFAIHNESAGRSPKTVSWHNQVLGLFLAWLKEENLSTLLDDVDEDVVRYFVIYLKTRPGIKGLASSHTVNNRVRSLRAFFAWLHRNKFTDTHRLQDLEVPKPTQRETEILTDKEIGQIYMGIDQNSPLECRDTAIFSLMLDTGLRLSEVASLKFEDVHLDEANVKVLGKGDKERFVSFGDSCLPILRKYEQEFRIARTNGAETFFLCMDGHPLSSDGLRSFIKRLSKAAGILRLHAHLIRHTYATRFLLNGGDMFMLQQNLGHTSLDMVMKYVHIANRMTALISREFSPLDGFQERGKRRPLRKHNGPHCQRQASTYVRNRVRRRIVD